MPSNHLFLSPPLLLLPSIIPTIRVFSSESSLRIRWQRTGASGSASVLTMNIQDWFSLGLTDLISQESSPTPQFKSINSLALSLLDGPTVSHLYMTSGRTIAFTTWTFVGKLTSVLFNMLSRFVIAFLPRSKPLLISWLESLSAVILEPKKIKSLFRLFPHLFALRWWDRMACSSFL